MPRVDLIRHGEAVTPGVLLGRTDAALSPQGWRQFEAQTSRGVWTRVVTSPLLRARAPAERLAHANGLAWRVDEDWAEIDFGAWDGRAIAELRGEATIRERLDRFYGDPDAPPAPGGESWRQLCARVTRALGRLLDEPGEALVVTHAGPMRAVLSCAIGLPLERTWAVRIGYGTRLSLQVDRSRTHGIWGEIVELVQP
jgi:alpha-ribazole phosphatase